MPVWAMIITDVVLTAAAIGVFMLFDYVMPQSSGIKGEVIATVDSSAEGSFTLPNAADNSQAESTAQDDSEPAVTTTAPQAERLQPHCVLSRRTAETGAIRTLPTIVQTRTL